MPVRSLNTSLKEPFSDLAITFSPSGAGAGLPASLFSLAGAVLLPPSDAGSVDCAPCGAGVAVEILILSGDDTMKTRKQLCELRLEVANQLGLRDKNKFALLWVVDFPMFEWSEEEGRLMAMHHPFTHPKDEDIALLDTDPAAVRADAYDMVCNGVEVGGGSIRIHDPKLQAKMFEILGFTPEKAEEQFGFLMNAFKYGAPPHGGLAYGLDRWVSIFAGLDSIRDCIAFPKNNSGRDVMLDAPAPLEQKQLDELNLIVDIKE